MWGLIRPSVPPCHQEGAEDKIKEKDPARSKAGQVKAKRVAFFKGQEKELSSAKTPEVQSEDVGRPPAKSRNTAA